MALATNSLPVPLSPNIRMDASLSDTLVKSFLSSKINGELPTIKSFNLKVNLEITKYFS